MMTAKRFNLMLCALLLLLVGGSVALTVYANIWLTEKSRNLVELKLGTAELEHKQRINQTAASYLEKNNETKELLEKVVPKSKDQAKAITELLTIAGETGVSIKSISFPASELGGSAQKPVAGTTTAAPITATSVTQAKPVEGISGVLGIEVSLAQIDRQGGASGTGVSYSQLISLLEAIEKNRRTMQIKSLQVQPLPGTTGVGIRGYSLSLTMNIFVKP